MSMFLHVLELHFEGGETGEHDELGNPILEPPRDVPWPAWWETRASTEAAEAEQQVVSGFMIYLPAEVGDLAAALASNGLAEVEGAYELATEMLAHPLSAADSVLINGLAYEVQGEPGRQPGGVLVPAYQVAAVERTTGA